LIQSFVVKMNFEMRLTEKPFNRIKKGLKVIEVRLYDDKLKKIKIGDTITFFEMPELKEFVKVKIIGLSRFKSFKEFFSFFGTEPFGHPKDITVEKQVLDMRKYYSEENEKKFGVLGIKFKLLL